MQHLFPDNALGALWHKVLKGEASPEERIDAAWLAGELDEHSLIPQVKSLLADEEGQVRYYALQALVLDLKEKTAEMAALCWRLLETDPDDDVRSMAAACLGSIYFGQKGKDVFDRLAGVLRNPQECGYVKGSVYSAMHQLLGLHPSEWPLTNFPRRVFEESDIDWGKVAALEDAME